MMGFLILWFWFRWELRSWCWGCSYSSSSSVETGDDLLVKMNKSLELLLLLLVVESWEIVEDEEEIEEHPQWNIIDRWDENMASQRIHSR